MKKDDYPLPKSKLQELAHECNDIIVWFCHCNPEKSKRKSTIFDSTEWDSVPLPSSWQSDELNAMSLRCYNLCVSFNVSHFSGWDPHEFSLRLMKTRASCTYFGLQIKDGIVAGFVPSSAEKELTRQWEALSDFLPAASEFKFNIKLAETKNKEWYQAGYDRYKDALEEEPIASNGEHQALDFLLTHSRACLELSREADTDDRYDLLMTCLSILLPVVSDAHSLRCS